MGKRLKSKLAALREDYAGVTGRPFDHFYCPILFSDEDVELCQAHIVNQSFANASRKWTIQRRDVDRFYGSVFESDFVLLQEVPNLSPVRIIGDKKLARSMNLRFLLDGKEVPHYPRRGPTPKQFTRVELRRKGQTAEAVLKMSAKEMTASASRNWKLDYRKDLRIPTFVSLLKAAYLTLFELLGYRYVFTTAGRFLGYDILGTFFLENRMKPKADALRNAELFFREFKHMVRPVAGWKELPEPQGSVADKLFIACEGGSGQPWALIVLVNTGQSIHAVMTPGVAQSAPVFMEFLRNDTESISGVLCRFEVDRWEASRAFKMTWPKTGFLLP